jgi:hypothetical protein
LGGVFLVGGVLQIDDAEKSVLCGVRRHGPLTVVASGEQQERHDAKVPLSGLEAAPGFSKATPDLERLELTHTVVADDVTVESEPGIDPLALSVSIHKHRHVEGVAEALDLKEGDIIICNGTAYKVRWPFDIERIGVLDPFGGLGEKPVGEKVGRPQITKDR